MPFLNRTEGSVCSETFLKTNFGLILSRQSLAAALAAAFLATPSFAQTRVEPVVVTASRSAESLAATLRDVTVIDGDELRKNGVTDLAGALQSVPGLEVVVQGPGATPSIFMRGANSNQTLVLIDGQRSSSSFNGSSAFQHLPVSHIERIEIVRGAAASLYGADAVGGVIHIFTRSSTGLSASAAIGEMRSADLSARAGFGDDNARAGISVSHRSSSGYNAIVNAKTFSYNPDRDGYRFDSASADFRVKASSALVFDGSAMAARGNVQYDGSAGFDDRIKSRVQSVQTNVTYSPNAEWRSALRLGSSADQSEFVSEFPGQFKTRHTQLSWQNNYSPSAQISLWNALEWRGESVTSSDAFDVTSRRTSSAVFGAAFAFDHLRASPTFRLDDSDQYGKRTTVGLALGYAMNTQWRVASNIGTSFKAPTFNDLYYPGFANPLLAPEKGRNAEVTLHWRQVESRASFTAYRNDVRDLIVFQCDANFNCAPQNVALARLQGITLAAATRSQGLNLEASLDVADPKNITTDRLLARRARVHGATKATGELLGFNAGVEIIASSKRFDDVNNKIALGGYAIVNAFARRTVAPNVNVGIRIDNAFDRAYQQSFGYASSGRRTWLTLSVDHL